MSPISVSLDGASDAIKVIQDAIIPWRKKHAQNLERLSQLQSQIEVETKKAEVLEVRARAAKERAEAAKLAEEATILAEQARKLRLENEKTQLELSESKIKLALDIVAKFAPNLSEPEKLAYVTRLLPSLDVLAVSEVDLTNSAQSESSP